MSRVATSLHRLRLWIRALFAREHVERELAREIALHIEMERDKLVREGASPEDAARRAKIAFGGVDRFAEDVRDQRGTRRLDALWQDARFALRQCARAPWVTTTMVAMLAIGIGANSVLFSLIETTALRPPSGIPPHQALVRIRGGFGSGGAQMSSATLTAFRAQTDVFEGVAGWTSATVSIHPPGGADSAVGTAQFVTSGFFGLLRVQPSLGQPLPPDGDVVERSGTGAVVSQVFWRHELGGSTDVIGHTMKVGGVVVTILGVAPPGFNGAESLSTPRASIWLPLAARAAVLGDDAGRSGGDAPMFFAVAWLRDGTSIGRASALARVVGSRSIDAEGGRGGSPVCDVVRLRADNRDIRGHSEAPVLIAILGVVTLLILAVICTNVSALLMGRAMTRRREIGVRLSMGASRGRLVQQLLTESALLSLAGGVLGLIVLGMVVSLARRWVPDSPFELGWWTVVATACCAIATGVLFGLAPALHATRTSVFEALKASGPGGTRQSRGQRHLVVAQIALSQPLLVGLGVLVAVIVQAEQARLESGTPDRTIMMELSTRLEDERRDHARVQVLTAEITNQIARLPGVERVSHKTGWETSSEFHLESVASGRGVSGEVFKSNLRALGPGYFDLLNVRLVQGREFAVTDVAGAPEVLVLGSDLATHLFGTVNPIGRRIACVRYCRASSYTVVGVVDATAAGSSFRSGRLSMYAATSQDESFSDPILLVRVRADAGVMIQQLRELVRRELPGTPITRLSTLAMEQARTQAENIRSSAAATAGGVLALLLAAIGLYAVVAHAVSQRTREIGVRLALGARRAQIVRHFFRDGVRLSLIGSAIGLPASVLAVRVFMSGIEYRGPGAWEVAGVIACLATAVAMLATWVPARRAARVDPVSALRAE